MSALISIFIVAAIVLLMIVRESQWSKERWRLLDRIMELSALTGISDEAQSAKKVEISEAKAAIRSQLAKRATLVFRTPEAHLLKPK